MKFIKFIIVSWCCYTYLFSQDGDVPNKSIWREDTALNNAVWQGDVSKVQELVEAGADINAVNAHGMNALMTAAWTGNNEALRILLDAGAEVNQRAKKFGGRSALMLAAMYGGNTETMRLLLDAGADMRAEGDFGNAFVMAANSGKNEIVKMLLAAGADVNESPSILNWAAQRGYVEVVKTLLAAGAHIQSDNDHGGKILQKAASSGNLQIFEALYSAGATNIQYDTKNQYDANIGETFLMCAVFAENLNVVKILLDAGLDVNIRDKYGKTALMWAAYVGNLEITRLLLDAGGDMHAEDHEGKTALAWAAKQPQILRLLLGESDGSGAINHGDITTQQVAQIHHETLGEKKLCNETQTNASETACVFASFGQHKNTVYTQSFFVVLCGVLSVALLVLFALKKQSRFIFLASTILLLIALACVVFLFPKNPIVEFIKWPCEPVVGIMNKTDGREMEVPGQNDESHVDQIEEAGDVVVELTSQMLRNIPRNIHVLSDEQNKATTSHYVAPPKTIVIPKDSWEPLFFESINDLTKAANWPRLRDVGVPPGSLEVRFWINGWGLQCYRLCRQDGAWTGYYTEQGYNQIKFVRDGNGWKQELDYSKNRSFVPVLSLKPRSTWSGLWRSLEKLDILTLPDSRTLSDEKPSIDGVSYIVEINDGAHYRTYFYGNPQDQEWPEANKMVHIARLLRYEFIQSLPK